MAPFGYGVWLWIQKNPAVVVVGAGLATFWSWLALHDRHLRREERDKIDRRSVEARGRADSEIQDTVSSTMEDIRERSDRINEARADRKPVRTRDELRRRPAASVLFRNRGDGDTSDGGD